MKVGFEYITESKYGRPGIFQPTSGTNPARVPMPEEPRIDYLNRMGRDGWCLVREKECGDSRDGSWVEFTFGRAVIEK